MFGGGLFGGGRRSNRPRKGRDVFSSVPMSLVEAGAEGVLEALNRVLPPGIKIVEAVRQIAGKARQGKLDPADINEQVISQHLWTRNIPDPDVLIRTSGEMRVSNFLLWQISYAEIVIVKKFWPDFRHNDLIEAVRDQTRSVDLRQVNRVLLQPHWRKDYDNPLP